MAKEPRSGYAKTRLAAEIGADLAQALAEAFVLDTLALAKSSGVPTMVAFAPADAVSWFKEYVPWAERWCQPDGNLGDRMRKAIQEGARRGADRCVLIGTDTPHLARDVVARAFAALDDADVCLGPARDGGYYLLGMRGQHPEVFHDIPWSTDRVHTSTLERCASARLRVVELEEEFDVDDASALPDLQAALAARSGGAPRTRRLLAAHWPGGLAGQ
ncbi:2-phospho-L-lactate guanylyltransferase [Planctomycetes bacterium Poly30]|uniref:2-phospho-L-lactate guanylyltransferase n=1 Tax=Saltatorellus ferox TaxID=2528018 RepID=A0A518EX95_9BACT|nr:2-phospho-L-lactate guanylyltransferase [Planctomycetes bacterium Poly30]